ncbi:MAG: DUF4249 domain-containing protein [Mangrovibacterium sp.]
MKTVKKYMRFLAIPVFLLAYTSCTERVEVDLEEAGDPLLVVFSEMTNEAKSQVVYLTRSSPYFENGKTPVVTAASLYLSDGTSEIELEENPAESGIYKTAVDYACLPGKTYTLRIDNVDVNEDGQMESYTASSSTLAVSAVESVDVVYNSRWDGWEVQLYAQDPAEVDNYYLFKVSRNNELYTDSLHNYWVTDDRLFNGNQINGPTVQYFDEEKDELLEDGDLVTLEMYAISKAYYEFVVGVLEEEGTKVPIFNGPSANPKGNISNGALGFFSVQAVSRGSTVYHVED